MSITTIPEGNNIYDACREVVIGELFETGQVLAATTIVCQLVAHGLDLGSYYNSISSYKWGNALYCCVAPFVLSLHSKQYTKEIETLETENGDDEALSREKTLELVKRLSAERIHYFAKTIPFLWLCNSLGGWAAGSLSSNPFVSEISRAAFCIGGTYFAEKNF